MKLLVIGAGAAGVAAAFEAALHAEVTVVHAAPGASALSTGALDLEPWEDAPEPAPFPPRLAALLEALGAAPRPALVATLAGRLRPARATDGGLLDLSERRGLVLLPRVPRERWDADALADALGEDPAARRFGLRFRAVDAQLARRELELTTSDLDLAAAADRPERVAWLAERLREAVGRAGVTDVAAVLLGPWLGALAPRASALSAALGVPCGEALVGAGSPAGLRFEHARDRVLEGAGVRVVRASVVALRSRPGGVALSLDDGRTLEADGVVVAAGGLLAGAFRFAPPAFPGHAPGAGGVDAPRPLAPSFVTTIEGLPPPDLPHAGPAPVGVTSSLSGLSMDGGSWPTGGVTSLLEGVGLAEASLPRRVTVCGASELGGHRTFLGAATSGLHAAQRLVTRLRAAPESSPRRPPE